MLRCAQFVEQVTAVEERAAGAWLQLQFQLHRVVCRHCRRYLRQMRAVSGALLRREPPLDLLTAETGPPLASR